MFYSEALSLRAQLQARPNPDSDGSAELLRRLRLCKALQQRLSNKPLDFYTCTFRGAKLDNVETALPLY